MYAELFFRLLLNLRCLSDHQKTEFRRIIIARVKNPMVSLLLLYACKTNTIAKKKHSWAGVVVPREAPSDTKYIIGQKGPPFPYSIVQRAGGIV